MVQGPNTHRNLDDSPAGPLLILSPCAGTPTRSPAAPDAPDFRLPCHFGRPTRKRGPTTPPLSSPGKLCATGPHRVYSVTVCCGNCGKELTFAVKTSSTPLLGFEHLLNSDLDLLCPRCESRERHGKR
uniref:Protein E7 n=1 Tax=Bovine papillomavirus TaxID=10571 RepID=C5IAU8_9PAPI|nr:E7 [Deltapapillomavirus 4]